MTDDPSELRYGLLSYPGSRNLGDEIQSLAARRFLPRVDQLIPREALDAPIGGRVKLILNGWFLNDPRRWPPHPAIEPLLVSFHLGARSFIRRHRWFGPDVARALLAPGSLAFFRRHAPIGARDRHTLECLRGCGVEAYYSGCATLTLPRAAHRQAAGPIIACDLPKRTLARLTRLLGTAPEVVTHNTRLRDPWARLDAAQRLLTRYAGARAVITTRLHAALPCLGLGTPVLFLHANTGDPRLEPALELCRTATLPAFLEGDGTFDPSDPPPNPERHLDLAAALETRCRTFVAAARPG